MSSIFDFDGKSIGQRALDALARQAKTEHIELSCRGTHFRDAVNFNDITFTRIDARAATFEHGLRLCNCRVLENMQLDQIDASLVVLKNVAVAGAALLRNMKVASLFIQSVSLESYASFDQSTLNQLTLRDVTFGAEGRFRAVQARDSTFNRVRFRDISSFRGSSWSVLLFKTCAFSAATDFDHVHVDSFSLLESRVHDLHKLDLSYCRLSRLRESTFEQPIIVYAANEIDASGASFERGLNLSLQAGTRLALARTSLRGAGLITTAYTHYDRGSPGKLLSLDGARLEQITLRDLDLSACVFANAHTLDEVTISGSHQLATAPRVVPWATPREILADEVDYRHHKEQQRRDRPRRRLRRDPDDDALTTLAERLPWLALSDGAPAFQPARSDASDGPWQPTSEEAPDDDFAWLGREIDDPAEPAIITEIPSSPTQLTSAQMAARGGDWQAELAEEIEALTEIEAQASLPTPPAWRRGLRATWRAASDGLDPQQRRERRARGRWYRPDADRKDPADPADPLIIAETYRALRRGRERARDWPGAADFYYGEMEMRRASARTLGERLVLFSYWLVSGYGLRAARACTAYLVTVLALAVTLDLWAVQRPVSFAYVLSYVFASTTVLARPAITLSLNTLGSYVEVLARLTGPAFFTLTLLALRARVRR
jgi:uncharacterized protein YjbI with pentapeptide repeats